MTSAYILVAIVLQGAGARLGGEPLYLGTYEDSRSCTDAADRLKNWLGNSTLLFCLPSRVS